jgi:hypothetical protein
VVRVRIQTLSGILAVSANLSFVVAEDVIYAFIGNWLVPLPCGRKSSACKATAGKLWHGSGDKSCRERHPDVEHNRCLLGTATVGNAVTPRSRVRPARLWRTPLPRRGKDPVDGSEKLPKWAVHRARQ